MTSAHRGVVGTVGEARPAKLYRYWTKRTAHQENVFFLMAIKRILPWTNLICPTNLLGQEEGHPDLSTRTTLRREP
jgi:hypothetical protein